MERSLPSDKQKQQQPDLTISMDASSTGWGAECMGTRTGGPWSDKEREMHFLELLAATLAVKCFAKDKREILIQNGQYDGSVLHQQKERNGIPHEPNNHWCLERDIQLQATHQAGMQNMIADEESRVDDRQVRLDALPSACQQDQACSRPTTRQGTMAGWCYQY